MESNPIKWYAGPNPAPATSKGDNMFFRKKITVKEMADLMEEGSSCLLVDSRGRKIGILTKDTMDQYPNWRNVKVKSMSYDEKSKIFKIIADGNRKHIDGE